LSDTKEPADAGAIDAGMRAALIGVVACAVVFSLVAAVVFGFRAALGVAIGGAIAPLNLWVFARVGDAFLSRRGHTAPWTVIAMLKLVFLLGGVWLLLRSGVASGLQMIVGYSALPVGVTIGSLFGPKPPDDVKNVDPKGSGVRDGRRSFGDASSENVLKARPSQPGEPPSER